MPISGNLFLLLKKILETNLNLKLILQALFLVTNQAMPFNLKGIKWRFICLFGVVLSSTLHSPVPPLALSASHLAAGLRVLAGEGGVGAGLLDHEWRKGGGDSPRQVEVGVEGGGGGHLTPADAVGGGNHLEVQVKKGEVQ